MEGVPAECLQRKDMITKTPTHTSSEAFSTQIQPLSPTISLSASTHQKLQHPGPARTPRPRHAPRLGRAQAEPVAVSVDVLLMSTLALALRHEFQALPVGPNFTTIQVPRPWSGSQRSTCTGATTAAPEAETQHSVCRSATGAVPEAETQRALMHNASAKAADASAAEHVLGDSAVMGVVMQQLLAPTNPHARTQWASSKLLFQATSLAGVSLSLASL